MDNRVSVLILSSSAFVFPLISKIPSWFPGSAVHVIMKSSREWPPPDQEEQAGRPSLPIGLEALDQYINIESEWQLRGSETRPSGTSRTES